jgi:hypothetical protein
MEGLIHPHYFHFGISQQTITKVQDYLSRNAARITQSHQFCKNIVMSDSYGRRSYNSTALSRRGSRLSIRESSPEVSSNITSRPRGCRRIRSKVGINTVIDPYWMTEITAPNSSRNAPGRRSPFRRGTEVEVLGRLLLQACGLPQGFFNQRLINFFWNCHR